MRTAKWISLVALAVTAAPAVANAQVYVGPGPFVPVPPHVYMHQRVRWHAYRHVAPAGVYYAPAPPPVWIAPAPASPPPPPVYMAPPPPPVYVQPQPIYVQPPLPMPPPVVYTAPAPVAPMVVAAAPPKPMFVNRLGLGATGEGLFTVDSGSNTGFGIMGQMRYRTSRHLALELMGGYERSTDQNNFVRTDVPLTFGLLIPFLGPEYALSPYLVVATGVNFADVRLLDAPTMKIDDSRTQIIAQGGFGLELRLGQHFAINGDARLEGRWNTSGPTDAVANTSSINGKPVTQLTDTVGLRVGIGGTVYF